MSVGDPSPMLMTSCVEGCVRRVEHVLHFPVGLKLIRQKDSV